MKQLQRRLQRLERWANVLPLPRPDDYPDEDLSVWYRGGCNGPLPAAGPRPAKYRSDEVWQQSHRFLLALICASVGRDDPPEMTMAERSVVDEALTFFASLGLSDQRSSPP